MKTKQVKKGTIQPIQPFKTIEEEAEYLGYPDDSR